MGGGGLCGLHWQQINNAQIMIFYIKMQSDYEANLLLEIHSATVSYSSCCKHNINWLGLGYVFFSHQHSDLVNVTIVYAT